MNQNAEKGVPAGMATYLIECGSQQHLAQDVDALVADLGSWWHPMGSTWLLSSSVGITDIFGALKDVLGGADGLLIIDVTARPRMWTGFTTSGSVWMDENYE